MWSPNPLTNLHQASESLPININLVYTPVDTGVFVTGYAVEWLPDQLIPTQVSLIPESNRICVIGDNVIGIVPIEVRYLLNRVPGQVTSWADLPAEAQFIYRYTTSINNTLTTSLRATALLNVGGPVQAIYTIQVTANYSTGRDRLVQEINARR